jgi:hypothetical protein
MSGAITESLRSRKAVERVAILRLRLAFSPGCAQDDGTEDTINFTLFPQHIVLTLRQPHPMLPRLLARLTRRLIGNPVKLRSCPAAVSENERRN